MTIAIKIQHISGAYVVSVLVGVGRKRAVCGNLKNNKDKPERAEVMRG